MSEVHRRLGDEYMLALRRSFHSHSLLVTFARLRGPACLSSILTAAVLRALRSEGHR